MTVQTNTNVASFNGNGVTQIFPIAFKFNNDTDLVVLLVDDATGSASQLTLNSDYTVSGEGDEDGGLVNVVVAPAIGKRLKVLRIVDILQQTDLRNQGKFFAEVHEDAFDLLTMIAQQHESGIKSSLRVAESDPEPSRIPSVSQRAGKILSFDSLGNPVVVAPVSDSSTSLRIELSLPSGASLIGGGGQVVESIAALRLLINSNPSKAAFVAGYYSPGDGGGGAYYLDAGDTTTADNGGSVIVAADGARWKLSQAGVVSVKQFGAKGDGVTDDTAAVQSACDAAGLLFVPAGTYLLSSRITVSDRPFMLYGGGKEVSVLLWSGIAGGFAFSDATGRESATRSPCTLRDLSIVTSQAGGGTALEFDYSADAPGSVYGDATTVTLNNVDIRGDDFYEVGATSYWTVNLHLIDAGGVSVDNARILGMQNGPSTTTGILIEGQQGYSIRYLLSKLHVQWVFWALKIVVPAAYTVEGVYLSQFEFVGVGYGVHVSGGMLHACEITTGHIDAENGCVVYEQNCYGSTALKLASCYLQLGNKRTGAYSSGAHISLPGVNHSTITGNYFLAAPAGSGVTHDGVLLKSTDYSVVDCNDFQNQNGAAIGFVTDGVHSDCVGSYAGLGNTFQGVTTELVNSNTITSAMLKRPKNFSSAWAPGTIAANSSATTLISLGGVLPGDPVQVSHTGMVASSCLISSYVTAPGQIEVIIFNNSGSPQAIGAGNAVGTVGGVV